jgi:hypothetical protein
VSARHRCRMTKKINASQSLEHEENVHVAAAMHRVFVLVHMRTKSTEHWIASDQCSDARSTRRVLAEWIGPRCAVDVPDLRTSGTQSRISHVQSWPSSMRGVPPRTCSSRYQPSLSSAVDTSRRADLRARSVDARGEDQPREAGAPLARRVARASAPDADRQPVPVARPGKTLRNQVCAVAAVRLTPVDTGHSACGTE